jgi:pimeloyl-ACP methyl ester carboxylesterase
MALRLPRACIVSIATAAACLNTVAATVDADCRIAGLPHEARCGKLQRPLDPQQPGGPRIDIHYVVVPAVARAKQSEPVFLLAGGPGQSALDVAPEVMPLFSRLNRRRDIVFVDQRGTGRSAPLRCEDEQTLSLAEQSDIERAIARLDRCRAALQTLPHGDLRFFTTSIAMADLDAVRERLGASRIDMVGFSYGTRAALEYLRQSPRRVRRLVLDGVAPPDMALPASMSMDAQAALDAAFTACEKEPACAQRHPALRTEWAALLERLPQPVTVDHPATGKPETFSLSRHMLLQATRQALYVPAWSSALPPALHDAARGRFAPLLGLASIQAGRRDETPAMGMHFSVVCAEDVPLIAGPRGDTPGAAFGSDFARLYERVCASWPRGDVPPAFRRITPSAAPVLLLSGGLDPVTPPRHGDRVADALGAKARHVVVPNAGHNVLGIACMADVLHRFIADEDDAKALAVDAGCAQRVPRPGVFVPPEPEAGR